MAHIRFSQHGALKQKLLRMKMPKPDSLATLLLMRLVRHQGYIPSNVYAESALCDPDLSFWDWIGVLKKASVIEDFYSDEEKAANQGLGKFFIRFKAGPAIAKYVNAQILELEPPASQRHVEAIERRVEVLEAALFALIERDDPPATEEKLTRLLEVVSTDGSVRRFESRKPSRRGRAS